MTILHAVVAAILALGPAPPDGAEVLHAWDDRRSAAWAAGDVAALRSLYTPGSAAGRADVAMLRAWGARGLRVEGLRMQLLAVETRRRTPDRLVLAVTDRLAGGVAMPGRLPLPRDRPSRHVLTLRLAAGEWRVAQAMPVRMTSPTVRSWKR
ncbi:MAG TPA: hypothetical protein VD864_07565 [Nocardioides sp.]|nr:hypothetical protein [Nocardioides sp.]